MSESVDISQVPLKPSTIGYRQSFEQWFEKKPLSYYEDQVLSLLPLYPQGDATRKAETLDTVIDELGSYMHELYIENTEPVDEERHIVIIHGYGASLGFFYRNFDDLSHIKGVKVHAIDLLGFGLSSRPPFPSNDVKTVEDIKKSENFFIDSLENWRIKRGIENFVLVGHSMGGYLSSCYILKYPTVVTKLVLISPVGVERSDYSLLGDKSSSNILDKPDQHKQDDTLEGPDVADEIYETEVELTRVHSLAGDDMDSDDDTDSKMGQVRRAPQLPSFFIKLWENHNSPFSLIRLLGPLGPKMVSRWSLNRLSNHTTDEEFLKLHMYAYKTFTAPGSGEYALTRLLGPGLLLRLPLMDRLPGVIQIPSLWLYGENDWMNKELGRSCCHDINKLVGSKLLHFKVVDKAGHHVYLDNPIDFDKAVKKFLQWR